MEIILSNNIDEIRQLVLAGYCPVECSIGGESIVDSLVMDHHGNLSHLEGVALRAYRDHRGARRDDPRFVLCGVADADAAFAIASLAGILPDGLAALSETVNTIDTDPIGRSVAAMPGGDLLLAWRMISGDGRDTLGAYAAVQAWRTVTSGRGIAPIIEAAKKSELERYEIARRDMIIDMGVHVGLVIDSPVWGFDVWYGRSGDRPAHAPSSWDNPIVVALTQGKITIGAPNKEVAETLLGPGGLQNVWRVSPGWGGREAIGGSPRDATMTRDDAEAIAQKIQRCVSRWIDHGELAS